VLPYGTDFCQCDAVVRRGVLRANERNGHALMYPTLPIGNNVNFQAVPFACRIRVRTPMQMLLDVIEALEADGVRKVVLHNSHGGNTDAIRAALRAHVDARAPDEGAFVCMTSGPPGLHRPPLVEHLAELLVQLSQAEWTDAFPYLPPDD
jgi:hypothetical protein